jgi:hypothetical protein
MTHPCDRRAPALFHNLSFCEFDHSESEIRVSLNSLRKCDLLNEFNFGAGPRFRPRTGQFAE